MSQLRKDEYITVDGVQIGTFLQSFDWTEGTDIKEVTGAEATVQEYTEDGLNTHSASGTFFATWGVRGTDPDSTIELILESLFNSSGVTVVHRPSTDPVSASNPQRSATMIFTDASFTFNVNEVATCSWSAIAGGAITRTTS